MRTVQDAMQRTLEACNIPHREIKCYGSQITIECASYHTAERWSHILGKFAKIRGIVKDYVEKSDNKNVNMPDCVEVYRLYGTVK